MLQGIWSVYGEAACQALAKCEWPPLQIVCVLGWWLSNCTAKHLGAAFLQVCNCSVTRAAWQLLSTMHVPGCGL